MYKQKPRVELKAEGGALGYGRASNMFGCESARMPCSIALFVVVCVLFSQQCPFSSRRLRELKAAAPRSRRQESKRSSPLCWARISKPPTSAGRAGRRASRVLCPELCRRTVVAALARKGQTNKRAPRRALASTQRCCCASTSRHAPATCTSGPGIPSGSSTPTLRTQLSQPLSHCNSNLINMIHLSINNSNSLNKRTRA